MNSGKRNIFITGGSGFLGKHFLNEASLRGFKFYILTRNKNRITESYNNSIIEVLEGDISEIEKFASQIKECSYFIHMAGEKLDPEKMTLVNVDSLEKVLKVVSEIPVMKFMHMSSCGVYGIRDHPHNILTEDMSCFPNTIYERSKLAGENVIIEFEKKNPLKYVILRPSNIFGEFDKANKLLNLIKKVRMGLFFYIDSECNVNYVYVKHVAMAMIHFIINDKFENQIYNVNSPASLITFINYIKNELKVKNRIYRLPRWMIYPFVLLFNYFPLHMQLINKTKYAELTNRKVYSADKLERSMNIDEDSTLGKGIINLISYFKKEKYL